MGILEILVILVIALIVIPPEDLPGVLKALGKMLRELRLASNTVLHELSSAAEDRADLPEALRPLNPSPSTPPTASPSTEPPATPAETPAPAAATAEPEKPPESPAQT